ANIYLDHLSKPAKALQAAARALKAVPHAPRAVALLDRLISLPETRAKAAELLESEYAESNDARRRAQALGVLLETSTDAERRLELYNSLAELEEHQLSSAGRAFEITLRAIAESPAEIAIWDRAGVLAV